MNSGLPDKARLISPRRGALIFFLPMLLIQLAALIFLVIWERQRSEEEQVSGMTEVARGFYEQILIGRIWNARHGGVYVEITPETQPNPYLDVPDRDIVSINGKKYTKINPAFMTRQLSEIAGRSYSHWFRIVSLKPVNPSNSPDQWEKAMLRIFEQGRVEEAITVDRIAEAGRVFKYFVPLKTEKPCLQCHEKHGYAYGDIRGGISIMIPMQKSDQIKAAKLKRTMLSLIILSAVSIILVGLIACYLLRRLNREINRNLQKEKLAAILELAGATAHELRQPMTVISSVMQLVEEKVRNNEPVTEEEMTAIITQCRRMDGIIRKMLGITLYRTKEYIPGTNIVDLDASAGNNLQHKDAD